MFKQPKESGELVVQFIRYAFRITNLYYNYIIEMYLEEEDER